MILARRTKWLKKNYIFILDLLSYCVCYYLLCAYIDFKFFCANPIKFLCVLKLCVLKINVLLQFADTIIVNIGAQLVRRAGLYYAGLEVYFKIWIIV